MIDLPQDILNALREFFSSPEGLKAMQSIQAAKDGTTSDLNVRASVYRNGVQDRLAEFLSQIPSIEYQATDGSLTGEMLQKKLEGKQKRLGIQERSGASDIARQVISDMLDSSISVDEYVNSIGVTPKADPTLPMIPSLEAKAPIENPKISAPGGASRVAKILNRFADIRGDTVERNKRFTGMSTRVAWNVPAGKQDIVMSQIDRAIGTMGVFGMYHDKKEAWGPGEIQKIIADLAGKLGVDATNEFETGRFLANRKLVAEVFHDMLIAIRHVNNNPDILDQASRDQLSAAVLEMSRILHDYATPRSRAIFQKMWKRVSYGDKKTEARFGLTADAAEIAAQGVQMPTDALPGEEARLQRVAAAQVGQVPQASTGDEPSATRELESELRGKGENVFDLQRYVDEFGIFGEADSAAIDIKGLIKYTGAKPSSRVGPGGEKPINIDRVERNYSIGLSEFLDGPLGFLADDALDMNNFFYETKTGGLKLKKLQRRNDFGTPIALRTNLKYRSRLSGDPSAAKVDMQMIVDAADRATRSASGSLVYMVLPEDKEFTIKLPDRAVAIIEKRTAAWEKARNDLAARIGDKEADAYLKSEEGIARFGAKPERITEVKVKWKGSQAKYADDTANMFWVMPESVAAEIIAANPQLATGGERQAMVKRLGDNFQISFRPVVSPQYIVLKNGTVVSARSGEESIINHRKVYPFKVTRGEGGELSVEQLDSKQYEVTDPSQRYDRDSAKAALRKFQEVFSEGGQGFNAPEAGPLFEQVVEIIRTDAYSALEILAMNGDVFPQLESELISSILEVGDFRVDRAPAYFKSRQGNIEGTSVGTREAVSTSAGQSEVTTMGLGTMKGRILSPSEARRLPVSAIDRSGATIGDVKDIVFNPERFGVKTESTIGNDVDNGQAIVRGLMLLKKMSMIAGVQIGYGGLRAPDLRYATRTGANELIRRDPFWMLADKEIYDRAASATTAAAAAERAFPGDVSALSTEGGRAAIQAMVEADEAAILAARAAVEVARGVLGPEWSIDLDPQYNRNRFPENPDTSRRGADASYYPYTRLMDSIAAPVSETVKTPGGALSTMRQSGALSSKADKFFVDLLRSGVEIGPSNLPELAAGDKVVGIDQSSRPLIIRDGTKLSWDPETGWVIEQKPAVAGGGEVARGRKKFLVSDLPPQDQDALTVAMVNRIREFFGAEKTVTVKPSGRQQFNEPTTFGQGAAQPPSKLELTQGLPKATFRTIEEVRKVVDPKEVLSLFDPVVERSVKDQVVTEKRKSGKKRTFNIPLQSPEETRVLVERLGDAIASSGKPGQAVPEGQIKIVKPDGSEEVVGVVDFLKRRKTSKSVFDDMDGIEVTSDIEGDYSWSNYQDDIEADVTPTEQPMTAAVRGAEKRTARKLALRMAIELQRRGSTSAQDVIESVLTEFKSEMPEVSDVKSLNRFFTKFWDEFTTITLGKNVYTKARTLVRAMGKNIWVEKGIALLNQGPEGTPALGITTRPVNEDKSGQTTYGPEETIVVTKKGNRLINADVSLPILRELRPIFMDADLKVARPIYGFFAEFFKVSPTTVDGEVQLPRLSSGPATKIIDVSVRQITQGKVPEFDTEMVKDSTVRSVSMNEQGTPLATPLSATGRPKKTAADTGEFNVDDLSGGFYEGQMSGEVDIPGGEGDPDMNYSVRQGKLLGLLQPDRLLPKMSPRVRSIDASIRTPVGGTVAGAALDFATLGIGGNLTPENALFTGALNATQLLSKSPLKSTAIGAAASLGATALTGGDIGRTLFNLVGSMGGGLIGGVASGGLGSLGGSVAGGFVADELWKALFNQDAGWQVRKNVPAPELKVRVP